MDQWTLVMDMTNLGRKHLWRPGINLFIKESDPPRLLLRHHMLVPVSQWAARNALRCSGVVVARAHASIRRTAGPRLHPSGRARRQQHILGQADWAAAWRADAATHSAFVWVRARDLARVSRHGVVSDIAAS